MNIDVDLNDVVLELLEQNKNLTLENILLKKALEKAESMLYPAPIHESTSGEVDI